MSALVLLAVAPLGRAQAPAAAPSIRSLPVTAGNHFSCAVFRESARCWGDNDIGQVGNPIAEKSSQGPLQVKGMSSGVTAIASGPTHTCAVMKSEVWCWGGNEGGQLGDGSKINSRVPVQVKGLPAVAPSMLAAGALHTCALIAGEIWCWGDPKLLGALQGTPDFEIASKGGPSKVALPEKANWITAGTSHSCALVAGVPWCWGENSHGQLATGDTVASAVPIRSKDTVAIATLSTYGDRNCGISDGKVACWGENKRGEMLGNGSLEAKDDVLASTGVQNLPKGATSVAVGARHICVIASSQLWCWGENNHGELAQSWLKTTLKVINARISDGQRIASATPLKAEELTEQPLGIAAGDSHSCGLFTDGSLRCWGSNEIGELGLQFSLLSYFLRFGRGGGYSTFPIPVAGLK